MPIGWSSTLDAEILFTAKLVPQNSVNSSQRSQLPFNLIVIDLKFQHTVETFPVWSIVMWAISIDLRIKTTITFVTYWDIDESPLKVSRIWKLSILLDSGYQQINIIYHSFLFWQILCAILGFVCIDFDLYLFWFVCIYFDLYVFIFIFK